MQTSNGITALSISATNRGKTTTTHPTLLWDQDNVILVDTAFPGQLPLIKEAMAQAGFPFEKLTTVILTHQDLDHIGNLPNIREEAPHAEVLSHELERPYIQGDKLLIKVTPESIERSLSNLPPHSTDEERQALRAKINNPPRAQVDRTIAGGDTLPYSGSLIVIDTPGHTPGHISLYHQASKTLIAGDALFAGEGELLLPPPEYCSDYALTIESVRKLADLDIESIICYHGGMIQGDIKGRIGKLVD